MSSTRWTELSDYSACEIADALLKLKVPGAGFLADILPIPHPTQSTLSKRTPAKIVAFASTFLMVPKETPSFPNPAPTPDNTPESNLTSSAPYADHTRRNTIVLISQPRGQACAVVGGIMAARMQYLGAAGIVVDGRVRDLGTLRELDLPIWSKGTSVVGAGAETKFHAMEVPIQIGEVRVEPGDVVMVDEREGGVVVVPRGLVDRVREMLPAMVDADEDVIADVMEGASVEEAFAKYRK